MLKRRAPIYNSDFRLNSGSTSKVCALPVAVKFQLCPIPCCLKNEVRAADAPLTWPTVICLFLVRPQTELLLFTHYVWKCAKRLLTYRLGGHVFPGKFSSFRDREYAVNLLSGKFTTVNFLGVVTEPRREPLVCPPGEISLQKRGFSLRSSFFCTAVASLIVVRALLV